MLVHDVDFAVSELELSLALCDYGIRGFYVFGYSEHIGDPMPAGVKLLLGLTAHNN